MVGLSETERQLLCDFFHHYPEITEVRIFGSRAKGTHKKFSDIDLAVWGNIDELFLAKINLLLEELPLPYTFDLIAYERIMNPHLKAHIDRQGKKLFPIMDHSFPE